MFNRFKHRDEKEEKENATDLAGIQSKFTAVRKGLKSRVETRAKLEELKRQMEMDFDAKYKAFRGIDNGMKASEGKLKSLIAVKRKNNQAAPFRGNISEDTVQQTLDHYSGIYAKAMKRSIRETDKSVKEYIQNLALPLEKLKVDGASYTKLKSSHSNNVASKLKTILNRDKTNGLTPGIDAVKTGKQPNHGARNPLFNFN